MHQKLREILVHRVISHAWHVSMYLHNDSCDVVAVLAHSWPWLFTVALLHALCIDCAMPLVMSRGSPYVVVVNTNELKNACFFYRPATP